MKERIIVSLTTWSKRIQNIPTVLDTIFAQTLPPDLVVLNLAYEEVIPPNINDYIEVHHIEVNRVPDTKVYKKILPTLRKYPDDCIIPIDDDWLYPKGMIEDFMQVHKCYPNNPISGNRVVHEYLFCQCHCGCASLVKTSYFGDYLKEIDDVFIDHCPADDIVWTFFANKTNHPYIRSKGVYFTNMTPYNSFGSYSTEKVMTNGIDETSNYLIERFGAIDTNYVKPFVKDDYLSDLIMGISYSLYSSINEKYQILINSKSYAIASAILNVRAKIRHLLNI